jgi:hypothetical protein
MYVCSAGPTNAQSALPLSAQRRGMRGWDGKKKNATDQQRQVDVEEAR